MPPRRARFGLVILLGGAAWSGACATGEATHRPQAFPGAATPAVVDAARPRIPVEAGAVIAAALELRGISYRLGGEDPETGFDCSGFVRYVYQQALGSELPGNSTSQFAEGDRVDKSDLKMGDLVFFKTHGKRVSHVGIYLDNGLFIHAPSRGKRVRIDHLDESYWAKRFAGAKRPDALT